MLPPLASPSAGDSPGASATAPGAPSSSKTGVVKTSALSFSTFLSKTKEQKPVQFNPKKESRAVWDLSDLSAPLRESPTDTPYVCYRNPSYHRQHKIQVIDEMSKGEFYVNLKDIERVSPILRLKLDNFDQFGMKKDVPVVRCGVIEFEILLRLVCNSYDGLSRVNAIGKYMHRMLVLAKRWKIPSIIAECERHIRSANYAHVDMSYTVKWFNAYEHTEMDEFVNPYTGVKTRPLRSHIIGSVLSCNRWNEFSHKIDKKYTKALQNKSQALLGRCSPVEIDHIISNFFDWDSKILNQDKIVGSKWPSPSSFNA